MSQEKIAHSDWITKGKELFGEDFGTWRFVCPGCGNIASIDEFRPFKKKGATPQSATQACIGRFIGGDWAKGTKPCNYAAYGLFHLAPVVVVVADGKEIQSFGFDGWPAPKVEEE